MFEKQIADRGKVFESHVGHRLEVGRLAFVPVIGDEVGLVYHELVLGGRDDGRDVLAFAHVGPSDFY